MARQILYTKKYARGLETAPVVRADETGAAVGKHLHWNWKFQNDLLTYVYQSESRGQKAIDSKFPKGLPNSTLVTDRHQSYFKMMLRIIKSVWIISSGMQSI
ncbi:transposase [Prevotella sp.]|uniref:transposase n=1 Tax=Prevotella sp. TaxID=59823 RepID=UPI0025F1B79B|nr:transposase [Prevotella sp.]